ncbi:hypothetical protein KSP40_PGU013260 [Platanthera guangdongensis]|uniref:Nucleolar protein 16 n=1 Tax=Platanthera guangdongensis TaxID=2320717 RepID=A0ABR2M940_9ASPA
MRLSRRKYKKSRTKVRVGLPRKKPRVFKPTFTIPEELLSPGASDGEAAKVWDEKGSYLQNYRTFGVVANPNLLGVRARTPAIIQSLDLQLPNHDPPPVSEFDPVDTGSDLESEGQHCVSYKWVFVAKHAADGTVERLKARLVTRGFTQQHGLDYEETFSPVANLKTTSHLQAVKRILRYLKTASGQGLVYKSSTFLSLAAYSDADYDDRRSTTGLKAALGKKLRDGKAAPLKPLTTMQRAHVERLVKKYGDDYQAMFMDTKLNSLQHSVATLKKLCKRYHVRRKHYITT